MDSPTRGARFGLSRFERNEIACALVVASAFAIPWTLLARDARHREEFASRLRFARQAIHEIERLVPEDSGHPFAPLLPFAEAGSERLADLFVPRNGATEASPDTEAPGFAAPAGPSPGNDFAFRPDERGDSLLISSFGHELGVVVPRDSCTPDVVPGSRVEDRGRWRTSAFMIELSAEPRWVMFDGGEVILQQRFYPVEIRYVPSPVSIRGGEADADLPN